MNNSSIQDVLPKLGTMFKSITLADLFGIFSLFSLIRYIGYFNAASVSEFTIIQEEKEYAVVFSSYDRMISKEVDIKHNILKKPIRVFFLEKLDEDKKTFINRRFDALIIER